MQNRSEKKGSLCFDMVCTPYRKRKTFCEKLFVISKETITRPPPPPRARSWAPSRRPPPESSPPSGRRRWGWTPSPLCGTAMTGRRKSCEKENSSLNYLCVFFYFWGIVFNVPYVNAWSGDGGEAATDETGKDQNTSLKLRGNLPLHTKNASKVIILFGH